MKRTNMKLAFILGLGVAWGAFAELPNNSAYAQRGSSRGGQVGNARSGGSQARGAASRSQKGNANTGGGFRGGGGIHAPAANGSRNAGGNANIKGGATARNSGGGSDRSNGGAVGVDQRIGRGAERNNNNNNTRGVQKGGIANTSRRTPPPDRTPSLSHPNPGSIRSSITRNPIFNNRGNGQGNLNTARGGVNAGNRNIPGTVGVNARNNVRSSGGPNYNRLSGIANRQYNGNAFTFNDRRLNLGSNQYRPSYFRHSNYYHGSWNGLRGVGLGSALAYGLGSRLGYLGSNPGYGWGLGNGGYGYGATGFGGGYGYGGRYGQYGLYGYRPLGWGLGGWGLGSLAYNSGYLGYSNPYYRTGGWSGYNYAQPVQVSYTAPQPPPNSSDTVLDAAIAAFRQQDYDTALDIANKGITQTPDDAVLHEFRALVLFAKQDYQQAATTIHSVLAVGPGWDWTTMSGIYADVDVYTTQLRTLEAFTKSNPGDAASEFLLAYHYLSCGHTEAATRHLKQVVTLMPNDRVAADILRLYQPPAAEDSESTENPLSPIAETEPEQLPQVDPKSLIGEWKANRPDGSAFTLSMTDDSKFTWTFTLQGQPAQKFEGTYSVEENVLALERTDGGSLIAEVAPEGTGKFKFRMLGAPEEDEGLDFSR